MKRTVRRQIPTDHPSLEGHFPGNPVVPGVVILEEVAQALGEAGVAGKLREVSVVKFLAPLRPGQAFTVEFVVSANAEVRFRCLQDRRLLAQGQLTYS